MPIELVASANVWAFHISLVILCFLSFILYKRTRRATFLLMFIGLIIVTSSMLVSSIAFESLFQKTISPESWKKLIVVYNLSSIIGYIISLLGCFLHVFKIKKVLMKESDKISN